MKKFLKYDMRIVSEVEDDKYSKIVIQPLERGFGITLGNALRRVLLSSIPGAAIFAIKIPGVTHEFQAMPGVLEDVTTIVLNLKNLVIKIDEEIYSQEELDSTSIEDWPFLSINKVGSGVVTGEDIVCPSGFSIINKDVKICTITDDDLTFDMKLYATSGRGFVSFAENREAIHKSVNTIAIDSDFSPVLRVAYDSEEYKGSKNTTSDRLVLEVATNGALKAFEAISMSAQILCEHLRPIVDLNTQYKDLEVLRERNDEKTKALLGIPIEELDLSVRSYRALRRERILTLQDLLELESSQLSRFKNLGNVSVKEIREKVHERGQKFKDER